MSGDIASSFRRWGHLQAKIDPFGLIPPFAHPELNLSSSDEVDFYRERYCGSTSYEFAHMHFPDRVKWLAERIEGDREALEPGFIFKRLLAAEVFEKFMHTRFVGSKRFSLEGCAALIPLLDAIIGRAADQGFEQVIIGMSHRGRLTALHLVVNLPASKIFASFEDAGAREILGGGDVKYHRGATGLYTTEQRKNIVVRMTSNPSHLEAINPVVLGRVRGEQVRLGDDTSQSRVLAVLIHGDAAFAGQGIAAETLNFAGLEGFSIGGTINIVVNNLIGFTAVPSAYNSARYATSVAMRIPVPIFHVNAEEPDEVVRVGLLAQDYRHKFKSEVVIDLIGYRRYGHNEADDPTVTSPVLYSKIALRELLYKNYAERHGIDRECVQAEETALFQRFDDELKVGRDMTTHPVYYRVSDYWLNYAGGAYKTEYEVDTAVSSEKLQILGESLVSVPSGFSVHPKLKRVLEDRVLMAKGEKLLDWGGAEAFAFASLISEGTSVRLVGQDSRRGTFSHRHAVLYDYLTGEPHCPLARLNGDGRARFDVYDSMLSEAAALGFEYGYSRQYPEALVCWEAQFGDFVNGAQIIIDQFIAAGEDKWGLLSGLVMLLPHGYEGMGPEHSSARIERFLQLAAEDNIQICQPSTAAQYFHVLRRQALRKWRKPLVLFTPKSMLRLPASCSPREELVSGHFHNILCDLPEYSQAEHLLFCTGKVAHDLRKERKSLNISDVAILTIEQLYPFPEEEFRQIRKLYPRSTTATWVQEEPANMGALFYMKPKLEEVFGYRHVSTAKRSASASPATGSPKAHQMEHAALMNLAFAARWGKKV